SGPDASAQEARERAAAQFASIHDRWSALGANAPALDPSSPEDNLAQGSSPVWDGAEGSEPGPDGVSVTPILGIATSDDSESAHRPRFQTLMGVPRSSPDIDALAGIAIDPRRRRDTVRFERPAQPSPAHAPALAAEEVPPASSDEASLAATSWPWERNAPSPRPVPPSWHALAAHAPVGSALVESSLDVSAEVAALRASSGRRHWFVGLGAVAAVVALFAVGAPRERTLALRWLRREYQVRVHASAEAVADTARALRPTASVAAPASVTESPVPAPLPAVAVATAPVEGSMSTLALTSTRVAAAPAAPAVAAPEAALPAVPATAAAGVPSTGALSTAPSRSNETALRSPEGSARPRATPASSPSPRPATRDSHKLSGSTSKARQQVAAARKHSQRPAALAANATKPRATHQNSPRKDAGDGIIRETPF
ncbi:MAG: hypothetical protein ABI895_42500, partial [Deltaproteobacteria bacterium]